MNYPRESWYEEDAGPLVRLYAVTRGRGRAARPELSATTLVIDGAVGLPVRRTEPEYTAIVRLCRVQQSVAEVSAQLGLPLTLTKVLIGDLIDDGRLIHRSPDTTTDASRDVDLLRAVLSRLETL
ncbi:DUF742 domain-containing protein [Nocardia blacklockiae]|uniref:DUF742 domain-containing protein n=1 Tax=Nocardia blacklockiae TaxID=480036 RepID=UPI0018954F8B|nr:DUF742 domain-containing protein [Nocardia blacklockiae]MBF6172190.1 DUF742 domain-containing protein [Nocardia blacklockiae]